MDPLNSCWLEVLLLPSSAWQVGDQAQKLTHPHTQTHTGAQTQNGGGTRQPVSPD